MLIYEDIDLPRASAQQALLWPLRTGRWALFTFLAISAFSLVYTEDRRIARGTKTSVRAFYRRRLERIVPAYVLAVVVGALVVHLAAGSALMRANPQFAVNEPVTVKGTVAQLLFVQNVSRFLEYQGNGPLWSMAPEMQLYAVFPLLFWALARRNRYGVGLLAVAVLTGLAHAAGRPHVWAMAHWFVLGAVLARTEPPAAPWLRRALPWVTGACLLVGLLTLRVQPAEDPEWSDALIGIAVCSLFLSSARVTGRSSFLTWRIWTWVGERSLSIYVFHYPIVWLVAAWITRTSLRENLMGPVACLIVVPVTLLLGHVGFLVLERRALGRQGTRRPT